MIDDEETECEDPEIAAAITRLRKRVEADKAAELCRRRWKARIEWASNEKEDSPSSSYDG